MKPIRIAVLLVAVTVVLEACSGVDARTPSVALEPERAYFCWAEASAGFEVQDRKWRTADILTQRKYEIASSIPTGLEDAPDREADDTFSIYDAGRNVIRPCKQQVHAYPPSGTPATDGGLGVISCRMRPDAYPDFYVFLVRTREHFGFTFIRYLIPDEENADKSPLELLEIGTCIGGERTPSPVVGDCVTPSGGTIVTTRGKCTELGGRFR